MRTETASVPGRMRPDCVPGPVLQQALLEVLCGGEDAGATGRCQGSSCPDTAERQGYGGRRKRGSVRTQALCRGPWALSQAGQGHPMSGFARHSRYAPRSWHNELLAPLSLSRLSRFLVSFPDTLCTGDDTGREKRAVGAERLPWPPDGSPSVPRLCPGVLQSGGCVRTSQMLFLLRRAQVGLGLMSFPVHLKILPLTDVFVCSPVHSCSKRVYASSCSRPEAQRKGQNSEHQVLRILPQRQQQGVPGFPSTLF